MRVRALVRSCVFVCVCLWVHVCHDNKIQMSTRHCCIHFRIRPSWRLNSSLVMTSALRQCMYFAALYYVLCIFLYHCISAHTCITSLPIVDVASTIMHCLCIMFPIEKRVYAIMLHVRCLFSDKALIYYKIYSRCLCVLDYCPINAKWLNYSTACQSKHLFPLSFYHFSVVVCYVDVVTYMIVIGCIGMSSLCKIKYI